MVGLPAKFDSLTLCPWQAAQLALVASWLKVPPAKVGMPEMAPLTGYWVEPGAVWQLPHSGLTDTDKCPGVKLAIFLGTTP